MPWWFFGGFRIVALGAMFYHEVISPFSVQDSSRDFMSPLAAQLTLEQSQLRQQQDDIRAALALAEVATRGGRRCRSTTPASLAALPRSVLRSRPR